jgi:hypothetical protein
VVADMLAAHEDLDVQESARRIRAANQPAEEAK